MQRRLQRFNAAASESQGEGCPVERRSNIKHCQTDPVILSPLVPLFSHDARTLFPFPLSPFLLPHAFLILSASLRLSTLCSWLTAVQCLLLRPASEQPAVRSLQPLPSLFPFLVLLFTLYYQETQRNQQSTRSQGTRSRTIACLGDRVTMSREEAGSVECECSREAAGEASSEACTGTMNPKADTCLTGTTSTPNLQTVTSSL